VGGIADQTEPPGLRGPLRGAGPRGHRHHGRREQIWGHPQAAQGAHGEPGSRGCPESARFWWCSRNSSEAEHFRSLGTERGKKRLGTQTRCVRVQHNTSKTSQNLLGACVGSTPRCHPYHPASGRRGVPCSFFLQTTQGKWRHRRRRTQRRLDRRARYSLSCGYCSSCHCLQ